MSSSSGSTEVERFRAAIVQRLGLWFEESKLARLCEVLERRSGANRVAAQTYLHMLESQDPWHAELRALAQELTVAETYFLRHHDQLRAFADGAVPERLAACAQLRKLSILSAGCASGEEAYSLAMLLQERMHDPATQVVIRAVDINPVVLEKARIGRYSAWALRETPADLQRRWFVQEGREFVLDPAIRALVQFEECNLTAAANELWVSSLYDIVFCRNVMMYFTPEQARTLVARITRALVPGGYLFLGHAETLRGLSQDYLLRHTHGTFYYQRKPAPEYSFDTPGATAASATVADRALDSSWMTAWIGTVHQASQRIQALVENPRQVLAKDAPATEPSAMLRPQFEVALDLLKQERFAAALESMHGLSVQFARDPETLLLKAVLLTHSGQLASAVQVCNELLAIDDLNAGAQYLLALCCEGTGDRQGAVDHHQVAAYLDHCFAMPRLQLGLLARRAGDQVAACRELGQALSLLQREEASRLLLFGGGFSRDALMALCRAELLAAGGKP